MISIVVPSKTDAHILRVVASLDLCEPGWVARGRLIVADNGLSPGVAAALTKRGVVIVANPDPFVFARACNRGVRFTNPVNDILILNDDAVFCSPYPVQALEAALANRTLDPYGIIGLRVIGGVGNPDQSELIDPDQLLVTDNTVCFVAVVIPRRVWTVVGPLDERYVGYGFDDDDYCRRVRRAGYDLAVTGAAVVRHNFHGTYLPTHGADHLHTLFEQNKKLFVEKWANR